MLGTFGVGGVQAGAAVAAAASPLGWVSTGLSLLGGSGLLGGSKTKVSSAQSGVTGYSNVNNNQYSPPFLDLSEPTHVLVAGFVVIGAIYAYKKMKKG